MADGNLERAIDDLGQTALRVKAQRDQLLTAIAPFAKAYEAAIDPGTSDLDNEQPFHLTVDLGACRKALIAYRDAMRAA